MSDITATLWFLFLVAVAAVEADVFYFNDEVDGFFNQFREDIKLANNTQFPLPDIQAVYNKDVLFFSVHGEMTGTGGSVRDLSTIKRTSNVTIVTAKEYFVFKAEFGLDRLQVGYKYKAKFMGIPLKGDLDLTVDDNSIYIELLVNLTNNRCSGNVVTVRNLRFTKLDRMSVQVTGFSLINPLASRYLTHSFSNISSSMIGSIEEGLKIFFKDNIQQFDFCKFGTVPENIPFDDMDSSDDMAFNFPGGINATSKEINAVMN